MSAPSPPERARPRDTATRDVARAVGGILGLATLLLTLLCVGQPISWLGITELVLLWLVAGGLAFWGPRAKPLLVGALVLSITLVAFVSIGEQGGGPLEHRMLPRDTPAHFLARFVRERDAALAGFRLAARMRWVSEGEMEGLLDPLASLYDELEAGDGAPTSPVLATLLGRQRAGRFDVLVHRAGPRDRWVVFLHGFGGNFAALCLVVARAAADAGWSTACPSAGLRAEFHEGAGPEIVATTFDWVREQGAARVVLAGLSSGAVAASALAPTLGASELDGLLLIAGGDPRTPLPPLRTRVIASTRDARFPHDTLAAWAAQGGAELASIDGDHFALVEQRAEVAGAIAAFLEGIVERPTTAE